MLKPAVNFLTLAKEFCPRVKHYSYKDKSYLITLITLFSSDILRNLSLSLV